MTDLANTIDRIQASMERVGQRGGKVPTKPALLLRSLILIGRALGELMEDALRPYGLTDTEFRVLVSLYSQPDNVGHPGELCVAVQQTPANMTRVTDTLVERGLISRVASVQDRRRQILQLTESGQALVKQMMPAAFEPLRSLLTILPDQELAEMLGQLKRIGAAIDDTTRARDSTAPLSEDSAQ